MVIVSLRSNDTLSIEFLGRKFLLLYKVLGWNIYFPVGPFAFSAVQILVQSWCIWGKLGKCIGPEHILTDIIFLFKYIIFLPKFKLSNYENKSLILKTGMSLKLEINTIFKHQMALVLLVCLIFLFVFDLRYTSHSMYILLSWVNKPQFAMLTSWLFSISETISLSFLSRSYDLSFFLAGS